MKTHTTRKISRKNKKNVRVLAQGTFDLLHDGHVHYLREAKSHGNHLTVIIARDNTVKRVKKHSPMFSERERARAVRQLSHVDRVILGGKGNKLDKVIEIRPDVIVLGYDQSVSAKKLSKELVERGLECKIVRAKSFFPRIYKSSKLKKALHQKMST
jgi:FAD synthetase